MIQRGRIRVMVRGACACVSLTLVAMVSAPQTFAAPPSNDAFAAPTTLSPGDTLSGTTVDATGEAGEPPIEGEAYGSGCNGSTAGACQRSVWYWVTPAHDGPLTLSICGATAEVFTGAGFATLGGVATIRPKTCPTPGTAAFDGLAGVPFLIGVAAPGGTGGSFSGSLIAAPETSGAAPFPVTASQSVTVTPRSPNAGATFQCSVDGGAFSACASPTSFPLPEGSHDVAMRAVVGGVVDPTPSDQQVVIDDTPPTAVFGSATPADHGSTDGNPSFTITSPNGGRNVECALDGETMGICGLTGFSIPFTGLCNGPHVVSFAVLDSASNLSAPVTSHWTSVSQAKTCSSPVLGSATWTAGYEAASLSIPIDTGGEGTDVRVTLTGTGAPPTQHGTLVEQAAGTTYTTHFPNLNPGTTYGYTIVAVNTSGSSSTVSGSFTTTSTPPGSASGTISNITDHEATFSGSYDPNGSGSWDFAYGTTASYGHVIPLAFSFPESSAPASFSYRVGGLPAGTPIHWTLETQRNDPVGLYSLRTADATFTTSGTASAGGDGGGTTPTSPDGPTPGSGDGGAASGGAASGGAASGGGASGGGAVSGGGAASGGASTSGSSNALPPAGSLGSQGKTKVTASGSHYTVTTGRTVTCAAGGAACQVTVTATAGAPGASAARSTKKATEKSTIYTAALTRITLKSGAHRALSFTLSSKAAKALKQTGKLKLQITTLITSTGKLAISQSSTVTLKRPSGH